MSVPFGREEAAMDGERRRGRVRGEVERTAMADGMLRRGLVVAADPMTQRMCRGALEACGLSVDDADSGMGALMSAREAQPDVIVIDQQLRDVSGEEAIGWLRANPALRATPIIVLARAGAAAVPDHLPGIALRRPLSSLALRRAVRALLP
jgi:CheY-like chemotaxis protein